MDLKEFAQKLWRQLAVRRKYPREAAGQNYNKAFSPFWEREYIGQTEMKAGRLSSLLNGPDAFDALITLLQRWRDAPPVEETVLKEVLTPLEIQQELEGLQKQYKDSFGLKSNLVSVTIPPVTLQDVYLGPFRILYQTEQGIVYTKALEPHIDLVKKAFVHPHVHNELPCLGEAKEPIQVAKEQGRLGDLFTLVRSVLETYNPNDPYCKLINWKEPQIRCLSCDASVPQRSAVYCGSCGCHYCTSHAGIRCSGCPRVLCHACTKTCPTCGKAYCSTCYGKICNFCYPQKEKENATVVVPRSVQLVGAESSSAGVQSGTGVLPPVLDEAAVLPPQR